MVTLLSNAYREKAWQFRVLFGSIQVLGFPLYSY